MDDRRRLLAKVHVAKKQLALDDDTYRDVLERVTGQRSAGELDVGQLIAVLEAFRARGWESRSRSTPSSKPHVRKMWALWGDLAREKIVTAKDTRAALRAYVLRLTGVSDPEWLSPDQASTVIESLKQWRRRVDARRKGA